MSAILYQDYRIESVYQKLTKNLRNEIIVFWLESGALSDIHQAVQRVDQVAFVVRNPADDVVGISSVCPGPFGTDGELYLNYRMFIHPSHRVHGLMPAVIGATRGFFDDNRAFRSGARGMLIYAENSKIVRPGAMRQLERYQWKYAGKDQRGIDVWRFDFTS